MRKLIFVFILISFGFSFAGWIHYFPQVIYGFNTDFFLDKIYAHKITTVGDDIIIAFARGKVFTRLIRMDKHGRITDDLFFGYYDLDTTVYIQPMGLERGLRSYLELYFNRRTIPSWTDKAGVLYLDSSLTVIDELPFDYYFAHYGGDICRVDSSYVVLSSGGKVGRISLDGDTIWHLDSIEGLPDRFDNYRIVAISPDKEFVFLLFDSICIDDLLSITVIKLNLGSGTALWVKSGLSNLRFFGDLNKNYFALYPTPDGGLLHYVREKYFGYWQHIHYYDPSGRECWVLPEHDYDHFIFWCFAHIDSNLYWAGGAFRHGDAYDYDSTFATIAKVRLEDSTFKFSYMKTFPIHGFVEKIIPFDDSLIIAGIGDAYVGEYSNYYFVMKTDTLGNTGISENHFHLPASPKIAVYPNPFNRACKITLPDDDRWRVKVFDLSGRLVHDFGEISGKSVLWGPSDDVKSGVYVVVAEGRGEQISGKVVYLK